VPRVSEDERAQRDGRVLDLFVAGRSYSEIGDQVALSTRAVKVAVKRRLATACGVEQLDAKFAEAYEAADRDGGVALRRLMAVLARRDEMVNGAGEAGEEDPVPDGPPPDDRLRGEVRVSLGTSRDAVLALAQERAGADVVLAPSPREYVDFAEWDFTWKPA
jgi:hypothetical protein